jgi:GntR family transcriptional regulator, transcriptional repressor for pyruvate dehydrogenase complex
MATNYQFERVKRIRISDTVIDQIISLINDGTLEIGDQLPSERDLVDQLQIARASVREALRILEFQGIIEVRPGKGAFIVRSANNFYSDEDTVYHWFKEHALELEEIFEVREALERKAAHLLASRISDEEIQKLREIVAKGLASIPNENWDEIIELDRKFHHFIGEFTGNKLLSELLDLTYKIVGGSRISLLRIPGRAVISIGQHQTIVDMIASRDPDAIEKALIDHLINVKRVFQSFNTTKNSDNK